MKKLTTKQRAMAWIVGDNVGLSSKAIWAHMMNAGRPRDGWSHPNDPDDLSRCLGLLRTIPEWHKRLPEMGRRSPYWRVLIKHWAAIANCMADEAGWDWSKSRSAPKTYELMRMVLEPVEKH